STGCRAAWLARQMPVTTRALAVPWDLVTWTLISSRLVLASSMVRLISHPSMSMRIVAASSGCSCPSTIFTPAGSPDFAALAFACASFAMIDLRYQLPAGQQVKLPSTHSSDFSHPAARAVLARAGPADRILVQRRLPPRRLHHRHEARIARLERGVVGRVRARPKLTGGGLAAPQDHGDVIQRHQAASAAYLFAIHLAASSSTAGVSACMPFCAMIRRHSSASSTASR